MGTNLYYSKHILCYLIRVFPDFRKKTRKWGRKLPVSHQGEMMLVIASDVERGYWSNTLGWVYDVASATQFREIDHSSTIEFVGIPDARLVKVADAKDYSPE